MRKGVTDVARSVHQRLVNYAHANDAETQGVLMSFAVERLLYRLGISRYREQFVLKGAMLFNIWGGETHRPTTDMDLLGYGASDIVSLVAIIREVCELPAPDDGLAYDAESIRGEVIREGQSYEGVRLLITARLGVAKIPVHVDVGFGDPITPAPHESDYPGILDLPKARLRIYPPETVVAEKLQAMVMLGILNSRTKDFYDLWTLSRSVPFDGDTLCQAIRATFEARKTSLPTEPPVALTPIFYQDARQAHGWSAFLRRLRLDVDRAFADVGADLNGFLWPPLGALGRGEAFVRTWTVRIGWMAKLDGGGSDV